MSMGKHERFAFEKAEDLLAEARELGLDLPWRESIAPLLDPLPFGKKTIANRLAVQPMEGFDAESDGSPSELTFRRYRRYAAGGSGLIWFEATSATPEGRSNPRQLELHSGNAAVFHRLVEATRQAARDRFGPAREVYLVLQLTHSGRYSAPDGVPRPLVAAPNPYLDKPDRRPRALDDAELEEVGRSLLRCARLARDAGFDGVDIKACHGYLLHELLSARERENSRFGGPGLENRARLLLETVASIREELPGLDTAVRLSVFDGVPFPHGFGAAGEGEAESDPREPLELVGRLLKLGCILINVTMGVPYYNAHVGRPHDRPLPASSTPPESPLEGVCRLLRGAEKLQKAFPEAVVVGTGYSWLRRFFPGVGAGVLARGGAGIIGLGRSSLAYPDAAADLMEMGRLDGGKVCLTCSGCTELMRLGRPSGCVVRDSGRYGRK